MNFLDFVFPRKCSVCGRLLKGSERCVCRTCQKQLPIIHEPRCMRCGKPIDGLEEQYCFDCGMKRKRRDIVAKGTALWVYDRHLKRAMADFKYEGCSGDAEFYASELCKKRGAEMAKWAVDAVIPVPLHWRKQWFRGYNQAELLADGIGAYLQVPVLKEVLKRIRYTKPQKGLTPGLRAENLKRAFSVDGRSQSRLENIRRVLLVDDIYTTGSTLEACAEVLCAAGVKQIFFACLCIGRDF